MLGASATTRMPREPPTRPMTIQGRRMPSRDEVRSLILPKNGLPTIASRAPVPATRARLSGARSIPTSELTFNAKVTSKGAMNSREGADVRQRVQRDETPSDPVCRGRLRLQRSPGRGSVLQSVQPGGGRQPRAGGGGIIPGPENVGHCALLRPKSRANGLITTSITTRGDASSSHSLLPSDQPANSERRRRSIQPGDSRREGK
jgi:hypothetical protein